MDAKNGQSQVRMTVLQFLSTPPTHPPPLSGDLNEIYKHNFFFFIKID